MKSGKGVRAYYQHFARCYFTHDHFFGFTFFTADSGKGRRMKEELRSASRSLRSLQDGNENRGQLFALLSQRCELFHADNPRFHEQFQPVGALTRCLPSSSPATSRVRPSMSRLPNALHSSISRKESPYFAMNSALLRARNASR